MKRMSIIVLATTLMLLHAAVSRAAPADEIGRSALDHYQRIQTALAADSTEGVREEASKISATVTACDCTLEQSEAAKALAGAARDMQGADLTALREQFKALSRAMAAYVETTSVAGTQLYFCPMAKAYWLQPKEGSTTHNPYLGKAMSSCGVKVNGVTK